MIDNISIQRILSKLHDRSVAMTILPTESGFMISCAKNGKTSEPIAFNISEIEMARYAPLEDYVDKIIDEIEPTNKKDWSLLSKNKWDEN